MSQTSLLCIFKRSAMVSPHNFWRYPTTFGHGKYFCLLRDLHIEQSKLGLHRDLIKGSGLDSVLAQNNLSTISTSTTVDVNNIKRPR